MPERRARLTYLDPNNPKRLFDAPLDSRTEWLLELQLEQRGREYAC